MDDQCGQARIRDRGINVIDHEVKGACGDAHCTVPRAVLVGTRDRDRRQLEERVSVREFLCYRRSDYSVGNERQVIAVLLEASDGKGRALRVSLFLLRCCRRRQEMIH